MAAPPPTPVGKPPPMMTADMMPKPKNLEAALYNAISEAEMTGIPLDQRRIRTKARGPKPSSAFGPIQITHTLFKDYAERRPGVFTPKELKFIERFSEHGKKMLEADEKGKYDDPIWGYGGKGNLSEKDWVMYERVGKKMLADTFKRNKGNIESFWREWGFGENGKNDPSKKDPRYRQQVLNAWQSAHNN